MRQPYKDKFLSDVDGDGCPIPYVEPIVLINIGRWEDDPTVQAMLSDHKCLQCPPSEQCPRSGYCEQRNPFEGQREKGDALRAMDGITKLSDSAAPDAYFGRKS